MLKAFIIASNTNTICKYNRYQNNTLEDQKTIPITVHIQKFVFEIEQNNNNIGSRDIY